MGDLLGEDFTVAHSHTLYRCLDKLLAHRKAVFSYLQERWRALFDVRFDVLLYDLTSSSHAATGACTKNAPCVGADRNGYANASANGKA